MVGAHVEEVVPRRIVLPADLGYLLLLLAAAAGLHLWIITHTQTTARDSLRFARTALNFESPNAGGRSHRTFADVLRDGHEYPDPPGFPLAVLGASKIVGLASDAPVAERMLLGAQLASNLAAILLVLPMYWLGRMLFRSRFAGFAAALLFQVLPTAAHITGDGLSDSSALLCLLGSLLAAVRAVRTFSTKWYLAAGIASGCGYLVRPEGMIVALALAAVTALAALSRRVPRDGAIGRMAALVVGLLLVAAPYMALIGNVSNKPTVNDSLKKLIPIRFSQMAETHSPNLLLAEFWDGRGSQTLWAVKAVLKETTKASHYLPFALGLFGIFWFRQAIVDDPAFAVVLATAALQLGLLAVLALKPMPPEMGPGIEAIPPYVSERHTLLLVAICCLFTGGVLTPLARRIAMMPESGGPVLLIALVASALPSAVKPLHENRVGHKFAGQFLEGKIGPHDAVIDPFEWAHYYSGHALYRVPPDPADKDLVARWVVWEPTAGTKQNPHSRLPRLEAARMVVEDGANPPLLVFQWPEGVPPAEAKVVVYRQMVRK